jgi:hypothetical protein
MTIGLKANVDGSGAIQTNSIDAIQISTGQAVTIPGALTVTGTLNAGATTNTTGSFSGNLSFNSGYGSAAVAYGCRAWVLFNGSGTPAIRASANVTSLTDTSAGTYFVNFTTAMPDANYSVCGTAATPGNSYGLLTPYNGATAQTTTAVPISTLNSAWAVFDHTYISVAIFR